MFEINYPNSFGVFATSINLSKEEFDKLCNGTILLAQKLIQIDLNKTIRESELIKLQFN